jgi:amino acid adenylation domain-containing protein
MFDFSRSVLRSFDVSVQRQPHAVSVVDGNVALTRSELRLRSVELAAELARRGVGAGTHVGICVDRSAALIVAVLGVLRTGAAYVPIDPSYPEDRIDWMLADCSAAAVILGNERRVGGRLSAAASVTLSRGGELSAPLTAGPVASDFMSADPGPSDPAYTVYTSGSTGRPKGVTIDHGGLLNLVRWHCGAFNLDDSDRASQIASPGFDAAVWETWPPLVIGAELHIVPEPLKTDPLGLRDWLVEHQIAVGFVPTAVAEGLITLDWPAETTLRSMLTGGDALTRRPRSDLPFTLVNNYGVSEAAVVATSGRVDPLTAGAPSIGRPIPGVLAEIVDVTGAPVPDGIDGELVLGGVSVGLGYLNRPELTAERFYADARGRWYRTGDRMRFTSGGELEYLGRMDDQLSVRGFRVEPAEIAAALNDHPAVNASVAVCVGNSSAERRLIAYAVASGDRPADAELSAFIAPRLPEPMRPSAYVWLDALPLTAHGKVDRAALPDPGSDPRQAAEAGVGVELGVEGEARVADTIAGIVADLLGLPAIGVDDNFFLLGGHSMLGAQLIIRLGERYDVEVTLRYLFDHPTATALAVEVQTQRAEFDAVAAA